MRAPLLGLANMLFPFLRRVSFGMWERAGLPMVLTANVKWWLLEDKNNKKSEFQINSFEIDCFALER